MATEQQMRTIIGKLPNVEERETWGHPTFRVKDKIFAGLAEDGSTATVKASMEEQAALIEGDPDTFTKAAYVGQYGWVQIRLKGIDRTELEELVIESWRTVAPKRMVAAYDPA